MADKEKLTSDDLDPIHEALAAHFADVLKNGEKVMQTDRETGVITEKRVAPSAAMLNQIRQFLKDNGIEVAKGSKRVKNILDNLPFPEGSERVPLKAVK